MPKNELFGLFETQFISWHSGSLLAGCGAGLWLPSRRMGFYAWRPSLEIFSHVGTISCLQGWTSTDTTTRPPSDSSIPSLHQWTQRKGGIMPTKTVFSNINWFDRTSALCSYKRTEFFLLSLVAVGFMRTRSIFNYCLYLHFRCKTLLIFCNRFIASWMTQVWLTAVKLTI